MEFGRLESPLVVGSYLDEALGVSVEVQQEGREVEGGGEGRAVSVHAGEGRGSLYIGARRGRVVWCGQPLQRQGCLVKTV
jgi:hypothetical protein